MGRYVIRDRLRKNKLPSVHQPMQDSLPAAVLETRPIFSDQDQMYKIKTKTVASGRVLE